MNPQEPKPRVPVDREGRQLFRGIAAWLGLPANSIGEVDTQAPVTCTVRVTMIEKQQLEYLENFQPKKPHPNPLHVKVISIWSLASNT